LLLAFHHLCNIWLILWKMSLRISNLFLQARWKASCHCCSSRVA
jgi:hypothetical protein